MATFPSNGEYVEALQNPGICFRDPELKAGRVELTRLGMPKAISGNFASVFSVTGTSGKRYAVKCFTREVKGQDQRYEAIHDVLAGMGRPWQVGFEYIREGVLVKGKWQPILRMEWVEKSQTLIPWLNQNLGHPDLILDIANQFATCIEDLHHCGIAHGDLQHGNLLVDGNNKLRVIDYDGMFLPAIKDLGSNELGLANYQHPHRSGNDFGPYLDRFSAWLIYGSLLCVAAHPWLWSTFNNGSDEKLLFGKNDFVAPLSAIQRLAANGSPETEFAGVLTKSLASSTTLSDLPEFEPNRIPVPTHVQAPPKPGPWWEGQNPSSAEPSSASGQTAAEIRLGTGWLRTHEGPLPPIDIVGPTRPTKVVGLVMTVVAILGAVAAGTASSALFGGLVLLIWATAMTVGVWTLWRRSDVVNQQSAARRELKSALSEVAQQKKRIEEESKTRDALAGRERKALQALEKERAKLLKSSTAEQDRQSKELTKKLKPLQDSLTKVDGLKAAESVQQLRKLQEQHTQTYLAGRRIEPGVISGIGPALVGTLAAYGIRTAADLAAVNGTQFRTTGSSRWFTMTGIGPAKSSAINSWHQLQRSAASHGAPQSLPLAHRQALDATFENQKRQLQGSIDALTAQIRGLKGTVDAKYAAQLQGIAQREAAIRLDFQTQRSATDGRIAQASAELQNLENVHLDARRNLDRFKQLSLASYLRA
jgi:predicted flap endonuclease-1-like 5' DNA nuclease